MSGHVVIQLALGLVLPLPLTFALRRGLAIALRSSDYMPFGLRMATWSAAMAIGACVPHPGWGLITGCAANALAGAALWLKSRKGAKA